MATALPYIYTAVAVGGTAASIQSQRKAQRKTEKADEVGRAAAAIKNQREIRQQLLQQRVALANTLATGQSTTGGFNSSGIQGASSSVISQGGANIGAANTGIAAGNAISSLQTQARGAQSDAATFGAIASLPGQFGFDIQSSFKQMANKKDVAGAAATAVG